MITMAASAEKSNNSFLNKCFNFVKNNIQSKLSNLNVRRL